MPDPLARPRRVQTDDLTTAEVRTVRVLLRRAFAGDGEGFTDEDWAHSVGGVHVVLETDGEIVAHASVVERLLYLGERPVRAGYVEAVATSPEHERRGFGSIVMGEVGALIRDRFELGALSTGSPGFYERLGWLRWVGPTWVRTAAGPIRTPDDDGGILVLPTPISPPFDPSDPISCEWRPGDVW